MKSNLLGASEVSADVSQSEIITEEAIGFFRLPDGGFEGQIFSEQLYRFWVEVLIYWMFK